MAIFGASQKDSSGNPISQVYVPDTANSDLTALMGGFVLTDGNAQKSAPATTQDLLRSLITAGKCFRATTGILSTGAANAYIGVQAIANSLAKHILIYNVIVALGNVSGDVRQYQAANATADTILTGTMTSGNQQPNGGVSSTLVLSCSPASTTQTTGFTGTQVASEVAAGNVNTNMLINNSLAFLKAGVAGNVSWYVKIPTSGNSGAITIEWAEL